MIRLLADENILGLEALPDDEVEVISMAGRAMAPEHVNDVDTLWVRSVTSVDAALLENSALRFVGTATAGTDHIDSTYLASRGISFAAAPGANANAVVEYVLAALLELEEPWRRLEEGGTLGIVGYGFVGRRLARVAEALGWRVLVSDPLVEPTASDRELLPLGALQSCSVISLHASLRTETPWPSFHLVDGQFLAGLRDDQTLVNASRGPVVDNEALLVRMQQSASPTVVLDVWEGEPRFDARLLDCRALRIATAHIAGYSWNSKNNATRMLWQSLCDQGLLNTPPSETAQAGEDLLVPARRLGARDLMRYSYRIADDDRRFRELGAMPESERAAAFDHLRKTHPTRFELASMRLDTGFQLTEEARRLAAALN